MIDETGSAPETVTGVSGLIDVHTHFPARAHRRALERAGASVAPRVLPGWAAEQTLDVQGDVGIEYSVLSPAAPLPEFARLDDARRATREFNEELADQIADDPGAYGGVAFLPLPYVDAALDELAYALDVLKLDGVHVATSYRGRHVGDPLFAPLLEELDRRAVTVMTHPPCPHECGPQAATSEYLADTARLVSSLLCSGALERFPCIGWILAHGGAALRQAGRRLLGATHLVAEDDDPPDGGAPHDLLRALHVDVVWNVAEPMLSGLVVLQGPDKLLFGSNMPVEQAPRVAHAIITLMRNGAVGAEVKQAVARDNALALFPSVARKLRRHAC